MFTTIAFWMLFTKNGKFLNFMGYSYFVLFTLVAISLFYFSKKLIKTLGRLSSGVKNSENSHEILLKRMIIVFTITYGCRAFYNLFMGHYYVIVDSYFAR